MTNIKLIKFVSFAVLAFPILAVLIYTIQEQFSMSSITTFATKWPTFRKLQKQLNNLINETIEELKLKVRSQQEVDRCRKFYKLLDNSISNESQAVVDQDDQSCKRKYLTNEVLYFHLLSFGQKNFENDEVVLFASKLRHHLGYEIQIIHEMLDISVVPQHLQNKFNDELYLEIVANELLDLRFNAHCRFTHRSCQNFILILLEWEKLEEGYLLVENVVFSHHKNWQSSIIHLLGQFANASITKRIIKIEKLLKIQEQFTRIEDVLESHFIEPKIQLIEKYVEEVEKWVNNSGPYPSSIVNTKELFTIDIFSTQYKIGVLLPILLILSFLPLWNLLKA